MRIKRMKREGPIVYYKRMSVEYFGTKPCIIKEIRYYNDDNRLERDDGPAVIKYDHSGNVIEEFFYKEGNLDKHTKGEVYANKTK